MSKRSDRLLLEDILESIRYIREYTAGLSYESFHNDRKTFDAIVRNLSIIGEAAGHLSTEFTIKFSEIEWYKVTAFRNRLVHEYFGVDYEAVWEVVTKYLSILEAYIVKIIADNSDIK